MTIKILGSGCANCRTLEQRAHDAVAQLGITAAIEKVQDIQAIARYGILRTPGFVIDEKVLSAGRVPTVEELKELIGQSTAAQQT
jgi:small redox-active disulfide protein 2